MDYHSKLMKVRDFVSDNFDDAPELVSVLGLSLEEIVELLPDALVNNYETFFPADDDFEETTAEDDEEDNGFGDSWEDPEA